MYNDNIGTKRTEWVFVYKGRELLPFAQRKLAHHQSEETTLRQKMSVLIQDPSTFHDDANLQQLKRDIDRHSGLREQFQVYAHEFARTPSLDFRLGLADVIYFGLPEGPWEHDKASKG